MENVNKLLSFFYKHKRAQRARYEEFVLNLSIAYVPSLTSVVESTTQVSCIFTNVIWLKVFLYQNQTIYKYNLI